MYRYNKVDLFLKLTNEMIDSFFPEKRIRLHENDKPLVELSVFWPNEIKPTNKEEVNASKPYVD